MIVNKHTINGKLGSTVCYTLPNIRFDNSDNCLKWDSFRFYTPEADKIAENGFAYFDVPADQVLIERDESLNKHLLVFITKSQGIEAIELLQGAENESNNFGLEGDIVISVTIPAVQNEEIIINYKEVTNGKH